VEANTFKSKKIKERGNRISHITNVLRKKKEKKKKRQKIFKDKITLYWLVIKKLKYHTA